MKKIIKPFDLEAAKKGAKVETRSGYKVTLAEERKPTYPVCGTFPYQGETRFGQWKENGEWGNNPDLDLVIVEYEGEEAPELKESEDEKVRKALITYFQRFPYDSLKDAGINAKDAIAWLEKQGEQKPVDEVEPKFKVGDWVIRKDGAAFSNGSICARVKRVEGHDVWFEHGTYSNEWVLKKITN